MRRRRGPLRLSQSSLVRTEGSNKYRIRREERRGSLERNQALRRYRSGRVGSLSEGKRLREQGNIEQWFWKYDLNIEYIGRRVKEDIWRRRKEDRVIGQYWRGKRWLNGRTSRGYIVVDYRTGARVVKRKPCQGERRRPRRMWRKR